MMKARLLVAGLMAVAGTTATAVEARAQSFQFSFSGAGLGGSLTLTYGAARDAKYPSAFEVTGISGTFFDTNNGLGINATVSSLVPIARATPDATNLLAPNDFSRFAVATGLPPVSRGNISYDNLLWPGGSPQTATDYPPHGGFLDIYGLLFNIGGGRVVNLWSNGTNASGVVDYGVLVVTPATVLDGVGAGVTATVTTPEQGSVWLLGVGAVGVGLIVRRRRSTTPA